LVFKRLICIPWLRVEAALSIFLKETDFERKLTKTKEAFINAEYKLSNNVSVQQIPVVHQLTTMWQTNHTPLMYVILFHLEHSQESAISHAFPHTHNTCVFQIPYKI
jgi:hypothetical protein